MLQLHIIIAHQSQQVHLAEQSYAVTAPALVLWIGKDALRTHPGERQYSFAPIRLRPVYRELEPLSTAGGPHVAFDSPHMVPATPELLHAAEQLAASDPDAMLRFVCAYCLAVDGAYSSALLRQLVAADQAVFEVIDHHLLKPWPASRYADSLGLPLRKLNYMFQERYGMSAKHWLLTQRLEHAHRMLLGTSKKIIDIALESGFCSPAHFSDRFRRHFRISPTELRRETEHPALSPSLPLNRSHHEHV